MEATSFDVLSALQPVRRSIGVGRLERWGLRGLAVGAAAAIVVLFVLRGQPLGTRILIGLGLLAAGSLAGGLFGARRWPHLPEAARRADRHFVLLDRLTTALERRDKSDPVSALVRADAAKRVSDLKLSDSGRGEVTWRDAAVAGTLALVAAATLLLAGGSPSLKAAPDLREQQRVHRAAGQIPQVIHNVNRGLTAENRKDPSLHALQQQLARLQHQLAHASTRTQALRAISATQQQLRHAAAALHPINPQAAGQLTRALNQQLNAQQQTGAGSNQKAALAQAAATLNVLASRLSHMSAQQRAATARRLAQAANRTSDKQVRSSLQQAASALGYNNPQSASQILKNLANAMNRSSGVQSTRSRLSAAASALDSLKSQVSGTQQGSQGSQGQSGARNGGQGQRSVGQQPGSGKGAQAGQGGQGGRPGQGGQAGQNGKGGQAGQNGRGGQSGKGAGRGQGQGRGQGSGKGQGQSNILGNGQGQGKGNGSSQGQSSGQGSARGGTGGRGSGGGRGGNNGKGQASGNTHVFVPGKEANGPLSLQTGPRGAPLPGETVPYQQVIAPYAQSAHSALDRSTLPPSVQAYVRRYFSSLSR